MINFHCTIIPVVVLYSVMTHTSAWFLDREILLRISLLAMYVHTYLCIANAVLIVTSELSFVNNHY